MGTIGLGWMTGCTKQLTPVVPSGLPTGLQPTATVTTTCISVGSHDPFPLATIQVANNTYSSRLYPAGTICGTGFNEFVVYVDNFDSNPATMEAAVYDNTQRVADASITMVAGTVGWEAVSLSPFSISCSDTVVLAVHAIGALLTIGVASGGANCETDSGSQTGTMPLTYPNLSFLSSSSSTGWCYEMSLNTCGP